MLGKKISQELTKGTAPQGACLPCEDIAAFADDRLSRGERERVVAHLADCRDCYLLYADTLAVRASIGGKADVPLPGKRLNKLLLYGIPTALAACLALLVFSGVFRSGSPGGGSPTEMRMQGGAPLPREQIDKDGAKPDSFGNMSGNERKRKFP